MGMINRIGCIAVVLLVLLVVIIGIAVTYSGLNSKLKTVESEMSTLKENLAGGLDAPRPLGRYVNDKDAFASVMAVIDGMKQRIDAAETLPELDTIFDEFQNKSMDIRFMIPLDVADDQSVRNKEANIDGVYNRYKTQREVVVKAIKAFNSALSSSFIGGLFGMEEIPFHAPPPESEEPEVE